MLPWFLKQLPTETTVGMVVSVGALQLAGVDLVRISSGLLSDLLGMSNWSSD